MQIALVFLQFDILFLKWKQPISQVWGRIGNFNLSPHFFASQFGDNVSQLEANIVRVQQKMAEAAEQSDELEELPPPGTSDEKRGRGRPRKHKPPQTSMDGYYLLMLEFHFG